jgi:hypothetical protein
MDEWDLPWEGGCRCGAVRIRITKPPLITGACHCTGCRRMSGSAFSLTVSVPGDGLEVTQGEPVPGGLQGPVSHHFHCADCKSWLFTRAEGMDWFVNVRAGALDDDGWVVPFIELWTREKLPWATTPARHSFETVPAPAGFGPLMQAFAEQGPPPAGRL